jgi:PAS domain S-box-containing protein
MRGADGTLIGFSKVTRDLTDRRQAEEALRQSEEKFRLLVESVQDYAIYLLDPQGCVQSWNKGAQRLKGYRPSEVVGEHFSRFYTPEDVAAGKPERDLETTTQEGRLEEEGWRVRKDGSRFWVSTSLCAMRDPRSGRLIGFSKVTRDLTERKRTEELLRAAYRDMEAFAYTVSHDLRAPLRAVHELADISLRDAGKLDPEVVRNLEAMRTSAANASSLVESLLRFSRANLSEPRRDRVDLAVLAREIGDRLAADSQHKVAFSVEPSDDLVVEGDKELLRVALENILSNAWKFTQRAASPRVTFGLDHETDLPQRVFAVRDNGAGFDAARAKKLFEPFQRAHLQSEFAGYGIGLATARRVIERHGGHVWADSRPGQGATFRFTLAE